MHTAKDVLIAGAMGGLRKALVKEALLRGMEVSVLVRSEQKLNEELGDVVVNRLECTLEMLPAKALRVFTREGRCACCSGGERKHSKGRVESLQRKQRKKVCIPFSFLK